MSRDCFPGSLLVEVFDQAYTEGQIHLHWKIEGQDVLLMKMDLASVFHDSLVLLVAETEILESTHRRKEATALASFPSPFIALPRLLCASANPGAICVVCW